MRDPRERIILHQGQRYYWYAVRSVGELGDGVVARVYAEQQRKYFDAPDLSGSGGVSKYR